MASPALPSCCDCGSSSLVSDDSDSESVPEPFDDEFVPNPVLAGYCLSFAPEFGFCKPPFNAAWLVEYEKKNGGPVGGAPTVVIGV